MAEKQVETILLDNGQTLEVFDISRVIAEDTALVAMIFRIRIKIDENLFKINTEVPDVKSIRDILGPEALYEVKYERNFIHKAEKEAVFNEVKTSFLDTNLKYLSHREFAEKFVLKEYINKK